MIRIENPLNWEDSAKRLAEVIEPLRNSEHRVLNGLALIYRGFKNRYNDQFMVQANGEVYCFSKATSYNEVRLYKLTDTKDPGYYFEQHCTDHFLVYFNDQGHIEEIKDVDAMRMKKDRVSGYHDKYWRIIKVGGKDDALIGDISTQTRLQKYIEAFSQTR
jgi:hypothetical protein